MKIDILISGKTEIADENYYFVLFNDVNEFINYIGKRNGDYYRNETETINKSDVYSFSTISFYPYSNNGNEFIFYSRNGRFYYDTEKEDIFPLDLIG